MSSLDADAARKRREDDFDDLTGRVMAIELIARGWLMAVALDHPYPMRRVVAFELALRSSLEFVEYEVGPREGRVREAMGDWLDETFRAVRERLEAALDVTE